MILHDYSNIATRNIKLLQYSFLVQISPLYSISLKLNTNTQFLHMESEYGLIAKRVIKSTSSAHL